MSKRKGRRSSWVPVITWLFSHFWVVLSMSKDECLLLYPAYHCETLASPGSASKDTDLSEGMALCENMKRAICDESSYLVGLPALRDLPSSASWAGNVVVGAKAWRSLRELASLRYSDVGSLSQISGLVRLVAAGVSLEIDETSVAGYDTVSEPSTVKLSKKFAARRLENSSSQPTWSGMKSISSRFIGQTKALKRVSTFVLDELADFRIEKGPSIFIFVGPPGTGKTYLASLLSDALSRKLITIDMASYKNAEDIDNLVGPRAGLVGKGHLFENLRSNPNAVVLLDEIEKAHPSIISEFLLPIFSDGTLQDKKSGDRVKVDKSVWILTSNCFEDVISKLWADRPFPDSTNSDTLFLGALDRNVSVRLHDAGYMCPGPPARRNPFASKAFLDRTQDKVIVFTPHSLSDLVKIAELELEAVHSVNSHPDKKERFNFLWTPMVSQLFARRNAGRSARSLRKDVIATCSRLLRPLVMSKMFSSSNKMQEVLLKLNADRDDFSVAVIAENNREMCTDYDDCSDKLTELESGATDASQHSLKSSPTAIFSTLSSPDIPTTDPNNLFATLPAADQEVYGGEAFGSGQLNLDFQIAEDTQTKKKTAKQIQELSAAFLEMNIKSQKREMDLKLQIERLIETSRGWELRTVYATALAVCLTVCTSVIALLALKVLGFSILKISLAFAGAVFFGTSLACWWLPWLSSILWSIFTAVVFYPKETLLGLIAVAVIWKAGDNCKWHRGRIKRVRSNAILMVHSKNRSLKVIYEKNCGIECTGSDSVYRVNLTDNERITFTLALLNEHEKIPSTSAKLSTTANTSGRNSSTDSTSTTGTSNISSNIGSATGSNIETSCRADQDTPADTAPKTIAPSSVGIVLTDDSVAATDDSVAAGAADKPAPMMKLEVVDLPSSSPARQNPQTPSTDCKSPGERSQRTVMIKLEGGQGDEFKKGTGNNTQNEGGESKG